MGTILLSLAELKFPLSAKEWQQGMSVCEGHAAARDVAPGLLRSVVAAATIMDRLQDRSTHAFLKELVKYVEHSSEAVAAAMADAELRQTLRQVSQCAAATAQVWTFVGFLG